MVSPWSAGVQGQLPGLHRRPGEGPLPQPEPPLRPSLPRSRSVRRLHSERAVCSKDVMSVRPSILKRKRNCSDIMRATIHNRDTDKFILLARRRSNHSGSKAGRSSHFVRGPPPGSFHARPPIRAHGTRNKSSSPSSSSSPTSIATSSAHPRLSCTSSRSVPSRNMAQY